MWVISVVRIIQISYFLFQAVVLLLSSTDSIIILSRKIGKDHFKQVV